MTSKLQEILQVTRARVQAARANVALQQLQEAAKRHQPRGFRQGLIEAAETGPAIIAELKRASPSKGMIRGTFPVARLARELEEGGASALSVLTEEKYFQGSLDFLREASAATQLPCLRKDFIVDEYQLYESRANSADAVLLIVAALEDPLLGSLHRQARELGLDVLVEVHDEHELERAVAIGAEIIGVNSRDLHTLKMDMATHVRLAPQLPRNLLRIAESGLQTGKDIRDLAMVGYHAFLIGGSVMAADDPGLALRQFIGAAKSPPLGVSGVGRWSAGTKD